MLKALLKKQLLEVNSFYFQNKKTGKRRSVIGIIGFALLFAFVIFSFGFMFYEVSAVLASAFLPLGLDWLYFAFMGLLAVFLGVFGSVFNTASGIYNAKDNDLLLSMPIQPSKILFVRLIGAYLMGLLFEAMVLVPTMLVYWIMTKVTVLTVLFDILLVFVVAFVVLVLTCALGWLVALISSKLKNKSFVTVFLSLAFIAAYYYVYAKFNSFLQFVIANANAVGTKFKTVLYPFYGFGLAASGKIIPMILFVLAVAVLMALTYYLLSISFIKIVTHKQGEKKSEYKEKQIKTSNADSALLRREFKHFASRPNYILNCGLGLVSLPVAVVVALIKLGTLNEMLASQELAQYGSMIPIIITAAICLMLSTGYITAPSISLEGKNIWIVQSMPIEAKNVLRSKQKMQLILTVPLSAICTLVLGFAFKIELLTVIFMILTVVLFADFMSLFGLFANLKKPNLDWTNEIVPIKQGMSVMVTLFGGWAAAILLGAGFLLARKIMDAQSYLIVVYVIEAFAVRFLSKWVYTKGVEIFTKL